MAAPGGTGPIGPFPAGVETDENATRTTSCAGGCLWTFPSGLYVVGSRNGDRRNLMTLNWCTQVSFDPKLLGISVEKTAVTHELIVGGRRIHCLHDRPRGPRHRPQVHEAGGGRRRRAHVERLSVPRRTGDRRAGARSSGRVRRVRGASAGRLRRPHVLRGRDRQRRVSRRPRTPRCCAWRTPA